MGALMSAKLFDELPLRPDAACSTLVLPPAAVHVTRTSPPSILMLTMRNHGAGRLSTTITRCVHVALLPQSSVTVQTTKPRSISIANSDNADSQRSSSSGAVVFRVVDASGLPYTGSLRPQISVEGSGTVRNLYRAGDIPGTYAVDIRTGTTSMQLNFTIGDVTSSVIIPVF